MVGDEAPSLLHSITYPTPGSYASQNRGALAETRPGRARFTAKGSQAMNAETAEWDDFVVGDRTIAAQPAAPTRSNGFSCRCCRLVIRSSNAVSRVRASHPLL